jgi:hypothetical protein
MRRSASWSAACAAGHPVLRRRVGWVHKGMPCYFHLQFAEAESRRRAKFSSPRGLAVRSIAAKGRYAPCSWTPEESRVESCEHQDDANIHRQPFPESVFEEREIHTYDDGCHRRHVEHDNHLSVHLWPPGLPATPAQKTKTSCRQLFPSSAPARVSLAMQYSGAFESLLRVMNDKTRCEHNRSAFGRIATKPPLCRIC